MKEISLYLEKVIQNRKKMNIVDYKQTTPYYLIITDDYKKIQNLRIVKEIIENKNNIGFGIVCMANNLTLLPNECQMFVNIHDGKGEMYEREMLLQGQIGFTYDKTLRLFFEK